MGARRIVVEAGEAGWNLLEYRELTRSLDEQVQGKTTVVRWTYKGLASRIAMILSMKRGGEWKYVYSPRTEGNYDSIAATLAIVITSILTRLSGGEIYFILTDANEYSLRRMAWMATLLGGNVLSVVAPRVLKNAGSRLATSGPFMFQISDQTIGRLLQKDQQSASAPADITQGFNINTHSRQRPKVLLMGALYPERAVYFDEVYKLLVYSDFEVVYSHRSKEGVRNSEEDYWKEILDSKYVITTSFMTRTGADIVSKNIGKTNHLIFRFPEVFVCKRLLISQEPNGCRHLITPGIHYCAANSPSDTLGLLTYYESNPDEYSKICESAFLNYSSVKLKNGLASMIIENTP